MDLLKAQLERLQKQFAGLTATQKMLAAALTAIMVITVVWWGKYAGEAEMVPLLNQSFSTEELGRIQQRLDEKGIHYTVLSDKVSVPADRRMEILSDLTYSRLMPRSTQEGFDAMLKQMSPFDPEDKQAKLWNHSKELLLSQIIGSFPDVLQADVMIDPTNNPRIGDGGIEPSATVNISLREGVKSAQRLVDAAADAVAGAQAGINVNHIKVVINGVAQKVHDSEDPLNNASDQLALLQQHEASVEQRVRNSFSDIPGAADFRDNEGEHDHGPHGNEGLRPQKCGAEGDLLHQRNRQHHRPRTGRRRSRCGREHRGFGQRRRGWRLVSTNPREDRRQVHGHGSRDAYREQHAGRRCNGHRSSGTSAAQLLFKKDAGDYAIDPGTNLCTA